MDADFQARVHGFSIAELRRQFPGEAQCHRNMLARARDGHADVHPSFQSFRGFLLELGPRPGKDWTVDRTNTADRQYAPGKVRWADKRQQSNNRSNTIHLSVGGVERPLADWARRTGQLPNTIRKRLDRGWTHEEAVYPKRHGGSDRPRMLAPNAPPMEQWPEPLPANFEGHYKRWAATMRVRPDLPATRQVFAYWIVGGKLRTLQKGLAARHPEAFGDEATDDDVHPEAEADPDYALFTVLFALRGRLLSQLTPKERHFHEQTLRRHHVTEPSQAVTLFRTLMKR